MVLSHSALLVVAALQGALASFVPFPLHHFAETPEQKGQRRFSHSEHHLLDGETTLKMNWHADADPDTIMGLDTEHEAGVRLVSCSPTQLVLHLPSSHVSLVKSWKHIVASEERHGCPHLVDHPLYHRIESMEFVKKHPDTPKGGATVVLTTKELYSVSQILPNVEFTYAVTPIDSLHPDLQEEARKAFREQLRLAGEQEEAEIVAARRLQLQNNVAPEGSPFNFGANVPKPDLSALGAFTHGFHKSMGQLTLTNSFRAKTGKEYDHSTWKPMTHANFGWNWNYHTNTTRNPQFKFTLPGMRGYLLLKNPYLKFLGNFKLNFTSHWNDKNPFAAPPHVKMNTKFEGNAFLNADLSVMANIYRDVSEDPFGRFHIPMLNNFTQETHFFKRVHFFMGNIPVSLQPGVSVNLNAYHLGLFKGAVRLGVNVRLLIKADVQYDSLSERALVGNFKAEALNVRILPPTWMIYTKHLEFGALLTPSFWLKGGFGPVKDVTLELQLRPYCNVSVTQEGESAYGVQQQVMEKELVILPFRAINLEIGSEWSVGIEANGRRKMTSTQLSLGVVEFNDYVEHFRFGLIDQRRLLHDPIFVALFKNGVKQAGKVVPIYCEAVVEGECQPAPFNAEFYIDQKTVIVQLTLAWHARPVAYLMSKVRAMSFVFPQIALSQAASVEYIKNPATSVFVKITRNGREYRAYATPQIINNRSVVIKPNQTQDLGVGWVDAWRIKYGSISGQQSVTNLIDPSVEVYYVRANAEERMAQTFMPAINWDQVLAGGAYMENGNDFWGKGQLTAGSSGIGAFGGMGGAGRDASDRRDKDNSMKKNPESVWQGGVFEGNVPLTISMAAPNGVLWADGKMGLDVHNPVLSNRWLRPYRSEHFVQGSAHTLYWSTRGASVNTLQSFKFLAFKVDKATGMYTPTSMNMDLTNQACTTNDPAAKMYMGYGDECVFSQKLQVDPGLVGVTVVFQLVFQDHADKTVHKMMSAPVMFVKQLDPNSKAHLPAAQTFATEHLPLTRRLDRLHEEGGNMVDAPPNGDKEVEIPMAELEVVHKSAADTKQESSPGRQLRADFRRMAGLYGYAPSNISFDARMTELHPICTRKPLHYEIGAGIFFRAKIHNFHIGGDSPFAELGPLANLASDMDTMDIPLANTALGKKLSSLFPKDLCTEGVCDGTLPGCPGQMVHPMTIPKVEFKMDKAVKWNHETQKQAEQATAYAMALLPEVIRITSIVVGSLVQHKPSSSKAASSYRSGDVIYVNGAPCRWVRNPECEETFSYRGMDFAGCSLEDHMDRGWCSTDPVFQGSWRDCKLTCTNQFGEQSVVKNFTGINLQGSEQRQAGPANWLSKIAHAVDRAGDRRLSEESEDGPKTDRFLVEFLPGSVSYKVDKDLIQTLARRQAFRGTPAEITGFRLHEGEVDMSKDDSDMIPIGPEEKFEVEFTAQQGFTIEKQPSANLPLATFMAGFAVLGIAGLVAGFFRVSKRIAQALPYASVEEEAHPEE